jgi:hypothetical protein
MKAEYITLSTVMCEVAPLLNLMKEAKENGVKIDVEYANFHCKIFEDNAGAIELAKTPKMHPRTKHLNIISSLLTACTIRSSLPYYDPTNQQIADIFVKPLAEDSLQHHRNKLFVGEDNNNASKRRSVGFFPFLHGINFSALLLPCQWSFHL